ncbi:hypothetical protein PM082_011842 [Marasmius tenuissimus]|nr:hypothetical protein PM082_011842 [Marasmius tenuissimus]
MVWNSANAIKSSCPTADNSVVVLARRPLTHILRTDTSSTSTTTICIIRVITTSLRNIPYKVCKTTDDCGTGAVKASDNFFMQDLIGPSAGSAAFGWGSELGGSHMTITADPKKAGTFNGKTSCSSCKCVVQLTSLGYACPFDNPGVTFWPNPKVTLKLQFLEIPCSGKFNF